MNVESDPLYEVEEYLKSFGGFWQTIPESLVRSIRELRANEQILDQGTKVAVEEARLQSYDRAIREFAGVCQKINPK